MEDTLTPNEYFKILKSKKNNITRADLKQCFNNIIALGDKYRKSGQIRNIKKLAFLTEVLKKEEQLITLGLNKFIYRDDIDEYIQQVGNRVVKIIEVKEYTREIPDEIIEVMDKCKNIFDEMYILFTDYTGREERKVEQKNRDKDPILFGVFQKRGTERGEFEVCDRFYILGDWVDEYCDLTIDKLVLEMKRNPVHTSEIPKSYDDLIETLKSYVPSSNIKNSFIIEDNGNPIETISGKDTAEKKNFFDNVRTFFKRKNKK